MKNKSRPKKSLVSPETEDIVFVKEYAISRSEYSAETGLAQQ